MKLTVLGRYGTAPAKDGACSGYLVEYRDKKILLDCGNGILSRLQHYCKIEELDYIILSHVHFDHMADLHLIKYALETKKYFGQKIERLKLLLPKPEKDADVYDDNIFKIEYIHDNLIIAIGELKIKFCKMRHSIESYGVAIWDDRRRFVYSSDTGYTNKLIHLAQDADILLCESTMVKKQEEFPINHHLTVEEACKITQLAHCKQLILTHFWYESKIEEYIREAEKTSVKFTIAEEMCTYTI